MSNMPICYAPYEIAASTEAAIKSVCYAPYEIAASTEAAIKSVCYAPYEILGYSVQIIHKSLADDRDALFGRFASPIYSVPTYEAAWEKAKVMAADHTPAGWQAVMYTHPPGVFKITIDTIDKACAATHDYYKNSLEGGGTLEIWMRNPVAPRSDYASIYIVPVLGKERTA
jgi:hypothetical protein